VAVDASGDAYVTGFTYSGDFPITSGAFQGGFVGDSKAFVLKLNPAGNALIYSTFLGGSGDDYGAGIAVDGAGEAHIAGYTASVDFPITKGAFQPYYGGGSYDGFLAKLNAAGSSLIYATYLGGAGNDTAAGVALDVAGNIYVTGQTQSTNFPTLNPVQPIGSESDAFVVKMNASGQVQYSTYLGGTGLNNGTAIAADAAGNAYVTGFTDAPDFPVTAGAYQNINKGSYDAFLATLNASGNSILNATYLGGSGSDIGYGISLDGSGNVYVAGSTNSINFPAYEATQPAYNGGGDAFVVEFNNQLSSLVYATYFGGSGNDVAAAIAADSTGDAYITGWTSSGESGIGLAITPGAFQPIGMGGIDALLAKFALSGGAIACTTSTPQVLTVQAGSVSQLMGDFILSCTGGTIGTQVTANIQAALNTSVTGSQPEIFVGANTNPIEGSLSGNSSVQFQGISFAAPGASASIAYHQRLGKLVGDCGWRADHYDGGRSQRKPVHERSTGTTSRGHRREFADSAAAAIGALHRLCPSQLLSSACFRRLCDRRRVRYGVVFGRERLGRRCGPGGMVCALWRDLSKLFGDCPQQRFAVLLGFDENLRRIPANGWGMEYKHLLERRAADICGSRRIWGRPGTGLAERYYGSGDRALLFRYNRRRMGLAERNGESRLDGRGCSRYER
jgi:hypothetical protein